MRYMGNVINHWLEAGIDSLAAAQAQAEKPRSGEKVNPALDYEQRSYADMNFEDDSFMEEARRILNDQNGGK